MAWLLEGTTNENVAVYVYADPDVAQHADVYVHVNVDAD